MQTILQENITARFIECGLGPNAKGSAIVRKHLLSGKLIAIFTVGDKKDQRDAYSFRRK